MAERPWVSRRWAFSRADPQQPPRSAEELLRAVAKGDESAFAELYDLLAGPVFGVVLRIVRDRAQSEEVTQEVFMELWRGATRYSSERASAMTWAMLVAHRRAVDRVRSAQAATEREQRAACQSDGPAFDEVSEVVGGRMEREQVRRCLGALTELQRESVLLAYYRGYTHREVAQIIDVPLGTVKTRLRDGLIKLRDCLGVSR